MAAGQHCCQMAGRGLHALWLAAAVTAELVLLSDGSRYCDRLPSLMHAIMPRLWSRLFACHIQLDGVCSSLEAYVCLKAAS